ncbi:MAG: TIGR04282 family arsenosugar biosynthesis glycosyltransferase [Bacteroidota bacterium]
MTAPRNALLIFIKNPQLGKAKTRIAQTVGDEKALEIYRELLMHTRQVTQQVDARRLLYYSQFVDHEDDWSNTHFQKKMQTAGDLGNRMQAAFQTAFTKNDKVVIIGSDCADLSADLVEQAFRALDTHDFVIGPATDGGYYLLGMNAFHPEVFANIEWSSEKVLPDTLSIIKTNDWNVHLLPALTDIDHWADWVAYLKRAGVHLGMAVGLMEAVNGVGF